MKMALFPQPIAGSIARATATSNTASGPSSIRDCPIRRTQIIRHVTEFFQDLRIAEIAGGGIASAAECNSAHMTFLS
jgi:hypothetical protein